MIAAACFALTAAALAYIVRYRVHIHITYQPPAGRAPKRRRPAPQSAPGDAAALASLTDTLTALGATRPAARAAAGRAIAANPRATSEDLLRAAIAEATRKGAA